MSIDTTVSVAPTAQSENRHLPEHVLKRDGRRVPFDSHRIVLALEKAFTATGEADAHWASWNVTQAVLGQLRNTPEAEPTVEQLQDLVEGALMEQGHRATARAYIVYRQERSRSRELGNRLMRTFETFTFADKPSDVQRENANVDANSAMGTMLKYGSESAKRFNLLRVLRPEHAQAHESGWIHIHDLDFLTLTMTCCQISLRELFRDGFSTGHGVLREPRSIASYASLACIAIQSNQNDQHGGQAVPNFDRDMAEGVKLTFAEAHRRNLEKALTLLAPGQELDSLTDELRARIEDFAQQQAEKETDRATYQAMEALLHNLNTMNSRAGAQTPFSSINYGTDTSPEGRMVIRNLLLATQAGLGRGETAIFPIQIFRVRKGVNLDPGDPNHDLFQLACKVSASRLFPNFSFQDAPFNNEYLVEGRPETEIAYMGCRTRVMANVADPEQQITHGRGNLSFTSLNLPRCAIEAKGDLQRFYSIVDHTVDLVIDQLLERLAIQSTKRVRNFPFLMGQGVWLGSKDLGADDTVAPVLRHGTLALGFIGLAETLNCLIGCHHGESAQAQELGLEIVSHLRSRMDEATQRHQLNFSLIATPAEGLSGRFVRMDQERYGTIPGVTDKDFYTNSFHIPVVFPISAADKITREAPYHALTNGGHISYVELDGDTSANPQAFEAVIRHMQRSGIGYGAINHPVDRDPLCGFTGVIQSSCPRCGRLEDPQEPFERIRRITGYLVGTLDRFNDAKRAEESQRAKHRVNQ